MLLNYKAVGPIEGELYILKVEKLDACIRPLFTNSVTYALAGHASCYNHILVSLLASSGSHVDDNALHNSDHTYSMCLLLLFQ